MPEIPPKALGAAIGALHSRDWLLEFQTGELREEQIARFILEAAAPILADAVAQKILEHAERQHPRDPGHVPTAWDRHFSIAARVAAGAFDTREDQLRMTADAIGRGDFIACDPPEVPGGC